MAAGDWVIEHLRNGLYDLTHDRHIIAYDLDLEEAVDMARRKGASEVTVVEFDGYRTKQRI